MHVRRPARLTDVGRCRGCGRSCPTSTRKGRGSARSHTTSSWRSHSARPSSAHVAPMSSNRSAVVSARHSCISSALRDEPHCGHHCGITRGAGVRGKSFLRILYTTIGPARPGMCRGVSLARRAWAPTESAGWSGVAPRELAKSCIGSQRPAGWGADLELSSSEACCARRRSVGQAWRRTQ